MLTNAQLAVMPTRPPSAPLMVMPMSGLPSMPPRDGGRHERAGRAARLVVTTMCEMATRIGRHRASPG